MGGGRKLFLTVKTGGAYAQAIREDHLLFDHVIAVESATRLRGDNAVPGWLGDGCALQTG